MCIVYLFKKKKKNWRLEPVCDIIFSSVKNNCNHYVYNYFNFLQSSGTSTFFTKWTIEGKQTPDKEKVEEVEQAVEFREDRSTLSKQKTKQKSFSSNHKFLMCSVNN